MLNVFNKLRSWVRQSESIFAPIFLFVCTTAFGMIAASYMSRSTILLPDEILYRGVMRYYATSGIFSWHALQVDPHSVSYARLYQLLYSWLFANYDAYTAVRVGKLLNCLVFLSAALPIYLLARSLKVEYWHSFFAALLGAVVPWIAMSSFLMPESFCYPLYMWTIFFVYKSFHTPDWYWDIGAVFIIFLTIASRMQFLSLLPAYLLLVLVREVSYIKNIKLSHIKKHFLKQLYLFFRRVPVICLGALLLFYLAVTGKMVAVVNSVAGRYQVLIDHQHNLHNVVALISRETMVIGVAIGLLPVIVGIPWYLSMVFTRKGEIYHKHFAHVVFVTTLILFGSTVYAQGGYLGAFTEERYYFYSVPLLWIAVFVSIKNRTVFSNLSFLVTLFLTCSFGFLKIDLVGANAMMALAPSSFSIVYHLNEILGLDALMIEKDLLATLVFITCIFMIYCWRSSSFRLKYVAISASAAIQVLFVGLVFFNFSGYLNQFGSQVESKANLKSLSWIDSSTRRSDGVLWANNGLNNYTVEDRDNKVATQIYWNNNVSESLTVSSSPILRDTALLHIVFVGIDYHVVNKLNSDGMFELSKGSFFRARFAVQATNSPNFQLTGERVKLDPSDKYELIRLKYPVRARWYISGLNHAGFLPHNGSAKLHFYPQDNKTHVVRLLFENPAKQSAVVSLKLNNREQKFAMQPHSSRSVTQCLTKTSHGKIETARLAQKFKPMRDVGTSNLKILSVNIFQSREDIEKYCGEIAK